VAWTLCIVAVSAESIQRSSERMVVIMPRKLLFMAIALLIMSSNGCSSGNFLVNKSSKSFYLTSNSPDLKQILCDSGDMDVIVQDSELPVPLQKTLKESICDPGKDRGRLLYILGELTNEQRVSFKKAFLKNGYEINKAADS